MTSHCCPRGVALGNSIDEGYFDADPRARAAIAAYAGSLDAKPCILWRQD